METIGTGITSSEGITPLAAMVMMLTAALVTVANTWMKWPVSTSQLAVFSGVGAAVAKGEPIFWSTTIAALFLTWFATPAASAGLGFGLTRLIDRVGDSPRAERLLRLGLLLASCYAAYTLGANNTGNSVGVLFGLHLLTPPPKPASWVAWLWPSGHSPGGGQFSRRSGRASSGSI